MKTVNLELSKQLKEAGYPQDTEWVWRLYPEDVEILVSTASHFAGEEMLEEFSSPTADEILEQLPEWIDKRERNFLLIQKVLLRIELGKRTAEYWVSYETPNAYEPLHREIDITLANAAAKMWLYLKKENLLPTQSERK